jgi:hypothetical protein
MSQTFFYKIKDVATIKTLKTSFYIIKKIMNVKNVFYIYGADRRDISLLESIQINPAFIKLILKKCLLSCVIHRAWDVIKSLLYHQ